MTTRTRRKVYEKAIYALLTLSTVFVALPVVLIVYFLVSRGLPALTWEFLTQPPRDNMTAGGIMPAIVGTLILMFGTILLSVPFGVLSAIYLTEYSRRGLFVRMIRLAIVNLAGVPSIVYGLFGLGLFVLALHCGVSILAGSLTLAVLVLPIIITASEEALLTVPQSFREASLALGATKWQTVRNVVLPNAVPGILTGVILGLSRAAGETAPILFTVAAYYLPHLPRSIFDQAMVLPYHLYTLATQVPDVKPETQWGTALVLLMIVLGMNFIATLIRLRFRRARKW
jgi:phosphate transport system permease protein